MKKIVIALILPLSFMFAACGVAVSAGNVSDKNFKEAYVTEEEVMERDCDTKKSFGKKKSSSQSCKMEGTGEFEQTEHPAEYVITLKDKAGNTEDHSVSKEVYDSLEIGDFYDTEQ